MEQSEIDAIKVEALKRFPVSNFEWIEKEQLNRRHIYVELVLAERQRAKVLVDALVQISEELPKPSLAVTRIIKEIAEAALNTYNKTQA